MALQLSAKERSHLKARAHALEPVVHIGNAGVTDAVIGEIERALTAHELIKVRAGGRSATSARRSSRRSSRAPAPLGADRRQGDGAVAARRPDEPDRRGA